jgi:DNA-binding NarL/FixJ family response regulator
MRIDEQASHVLGPHPATQDPTPSAVAVYREEYDRLVEQQVPEVREVAEMRAQGSTFAEIAESLNIDESTARRFMRRLRRRGGDDAGPGE